MINAAKNRYKGGAKMKIKYQNDSLKLLGLMIVWGIGTILILPIPWIINSAINYFSNGFTIEKE